MPAARVCGQALEELTRGKAVITKEDIHQFINDLKISGAVKKELKNISPSNYVGINSPY